MNLRPSLAILLLVVGAACADESSEVDTVLRSDSAGTTIVENTAPQPAVWTTGDATLSIGVLAGEPEYELSGVFFGRLLDDGRIVISDGGSRELRVFSAEGVFERRMGGAGEGPGEFGYPGHIYPRGDTLRVWDPRLRRFTDFDRESGDVIDVRNVPGEILNAEPASMLENGDVIFMSDQYDIPDVGFELMYTAFVRVSPGGEILDSLPSQPLARMGPLEAVSMVGGPVFGFRAMGVGTANGLWWGLASDPELRRFDADGSLSMIVRWPAGDRTVSAADIDLYMEESIESAPEESRPRRRQIVAAQGFADEFPVLEDLRTSVSGGVWAKRFIRPGHEGPEVWDVFDASGERVAAIELPRGIWILEISSESLLAVVKDELDVERVQVIPFGPAGGP